MQIQIKFNLKTAATILGAAVFLLFVLAALTNRLYRTSEKSDWLPATKEIVSIVYHEFWVDAEQNIPTWYSSTTLLVSAMILGLIAIYKAQTSDRYHWYWVALTFTFFLLALDQFAGFHEGINGILWLYVRFKGPFYFVWIVLALPLVRNLAITYFHWWRQLPNRTRLLIAVAACLYVGGAVGMEMVGGYVTDLYGQANRLYTTAAYLEELGEMIGATLFLYTLLDYIHRTLSPVTISFAINE